LRRRTVSSLFPCTTLFRSLGLQLSLCARADPPIVSVHADPQTIGLKGPGAVYSILIHGKTADGDVIDLTRAAEYASDSPDVVAVDRKSTRLNSSHEWTSYA